MSDNLSEIRNAIDSLDIDRARKLLAEALRETPSVDVYYLASLVALDDDQKMNFLQKASDLDPFHRPTQDQLAKLQHLLPTPQVAPNTALETSKKEQTSKLVDYDENFVVANVITSQTFLQEIPALQSAKVAVTHKNDQLVVVSRDGTSSWVNVIFEASTKHPVVGWIPVNKINNLQCRGKQVNLIDIPISTFEWHTREQVKDIKQQRASSIAFFKAKIAEYKQNRKNMPPYWARILGPLVMIAFLVMPIFLMKDSFKTQIIPWLLLSLPFFIGVFYYARLLISLIWNRNEVKNSIEEDRNIAESQTNLYLSNIAELEAEIVRLERIIQNKRPESEKLMEQQIKAAAITTALDLGAGIIKRLVPNKQVITYKTERH